MHIPTETAALMTTATASPTGFRGSRVLVRAGIVSLVVGTCAVAVAALVGGAPAAAGAAVGVALVLLVFGGGAFFVDLVAGVLPTASLLIALLTYTLQVLVMAAAFLVLTRGGLLDDTLDRAWLAGAVIVGTAGWLAALVVLATKARIPAFVEQEPGAR